MAVYEVCQLTQKFNLRIIYWQLLWTLDESSRKDIRKQIKENGSIVEDIEKQQLTWHRHVIRIVEERLKEVLEWVQSRRKNLAQKTSLFDN